MSSIVQPLFRSIEKLTVLENLAEQVAAGHVDDTLGDALHQGLKSFKQGTIHFPDLKRLGTWHTIKVTWSEEEGQFYEGAALQAAMGGGTSKQTSSAAVAASAAVGMEVSQEAPRQGGVNLGQSTLPPGSDDHMPLTFGSFETPPLTSLSIPERLNRLERINREMRRADRYSLTQQSTSNLSSEVLAFKKYDRNPILRVAHSNEIVNLSRSSLKQVQTSTEPVSAEAMEVDGPYRTPSAAKISGASSSSSLSSSKPSSKASAITSRSYHSLSKNQPILLYGFDAQRLEMKKNLIEKFHFQKFQTMNEYNACIGIGLRLRFEGYCNFFNQVQSNRFVVDVSEHSRFTEPEVRQWVECLKRNKDQFDFSGTLNTPEERLSFLLKNGADYKNTSAAEVGFVFAKFFREKNWSKVVEMLETAFDLLNQAGKELKGKQIGKAYDKLDFYQKKLLNEMVTYAFLRKTSKLGMTFAREQDMPVLFAWKVPDTPDDLNELRELLEAKPYKYKAAIAREIGDTGRITLEAITLSEMRELGRLRQKMMAPDYLLIVNISEDASDQKMTSSTAAVDGAPAFGAPVRAATSSAGASASDSDNWTIVKRKK